MTPLRDAKLDVMTKSVAPQATLVKSFENYLRLQKKRSPRTVERYGEILGHYFLFLGENSTPQDIREDTLRAYLAARKRKSVSAATQAQAASALKTFLKWAASEKILEPHMERFLTRPRVPKKLVRIVEEEDLPLLLRVIEKRPAPEQLLFEFLYGCGLRISEAAQVKREDIQLSETRLKVLGKGRKERAVPLTPGAVKILQDHPEILAHWPREAAKLRAWVQIWDGLCPMDGEGRLHPHKLRHSIASHLLKRGAKLPQIQKLLGHEKLATTERYTHLNFDDLQKAYESAFPLLNSLRKS